MEILIINNYIYCMFNLFRKKKDMPIKEYKRVINYYETDKMGITHHSNYIRFMEEARVDFLNQIGWNYAKLEEMGAISPVVNVNVNYKKPTTFSDEISIKVSVVEYSGVKVVFQYEMKKGDVLVCEAKSIHCFINKEGKIVFVNQAWPELDATLKKLLPEQK